jgi:hypothetical protein
VGVNGSSQFGSACLSILLGFIGSRDKGINDLQDAISTWEGNHGSGQHDGDPASNAAKQEQDIIAVITIEKNIALSG